jgi:hypothetical protein
VCKWVVISIINLLGEEEKEATREEIFYLDLIK